MLALISKEFQTWLQARAAFALVGLVVLGLGLSAFALGLLVLVPYPGALPDLFGAAGQTGGGGTGNVLPNALVPYRPVLLFGAGALSILLAILLVAPALAATAFGAERSAGTLDLLLLHAGGAGRATAAKIVAAGIFMALLCLVGLPSIAPAWMLGGVDGPLMAATFAVLAASLLLACSVGVVLSSLVVDTLAAAFFAQALVLALALLVPGAYLVIHAAGGANAEVARAMLWLSPLVALLGTRSDAARALLSLAPASLREALAPPGGFPVGPGFFVPPWVPSVVLWLVLAAGCWFVASVAIDPCHPARRWRFRPHPPGGSAGEISAAAAPAAAREVQP